MRRIPLKPVNTIYYIVDSNFFANKYLRPGESSNDTDKKRIENSLSWCEIINRQISKNSAIVYINELCTSETFKIMARKYYQDNLFGSNRYQAIRKQIASDIQLSVSEILSKARSIKYHNIAVDRDVIIGASRYLEIAYKNECRSLSVTDLSILSCAKYLIDFYKINKEQIFILSGDKKLRKCSVKANDGTIVIDSLEPKNNFKKYFIN